VAGREALILANRWTARKEPCADLRAAIEKGRGCFGFHTLVDDFGGVLSAAASGRTRRCNQLGTQSNEKPASQEKIRVEREKLHRHVQIFEISQRLWHHMVPDSKVVHFSFRRRKNDFALELLVRSTAHQ
jgi:hypothetical protein